ncbi:MAG: hypothetical protein S4CHLAM81_10320 [Chlamydiales bacterium]|nr:hypothetical protein [Chlamydiales bacterium]MCH9635810.1 hypothetical protein [Chlamydiales bacterium]MCH9703937.1 DUF368 domain-containing protein [Chlamydiota bacterium]
MRLFFIGMLMGICDLIPGVSGGTVAYASGVYDDFLKAIQSLSFTDLKRVHWRFILPVVGGVAFSVLLFSKWVFFLLTHYQLLLFALFFGAIFGNCASSLKRPNRMLFIGFICSFALCSLPIRECMAISIFWLFFCGMLGAAAMLLPGISGSFMLHILGVYTLFIQALSLLDLKFLLVIGLGIAAGFVVFSRAASRLLEKYPSGMHSFLVGSMLGGLRSLWPYDGHNLLSATSLMVLGFLLVFFLERKRSLLVK